MNKSSLLVLPKRFFIFFLLFFIGCLTPEEPKFEFKEGLIYIDALAATSPGGSYVKITETIFQLEALVNVFVSGAIVSFINTESGLEVPLSELNGTYVPPVDFVVATGETWELFVALANGTRYRSESEKVVSAGSLTNIKATYREELSFRADLDRYIPGHYLTVDVDNPEEEENFFFWKFRSFETLRICESCWNQVYRDGECIDVVPDPNNGEVANLEFADYLCDEECWRIRYNEDINVFSDKFSAGNSIPNLLVAKVPLYSKANMVVELQQFSLTEKAYDYYKELKDLIDNNAGLNAPPPAALIGNIYNVGDEQEYVLGRFTAAPSVTSSLFIDRESVPGAATETGHTYKTECYIFCGIVQCNLGCEYEIDMPCTETRFRTSIKPEGWID